jgi:hypothetical protein
MAALIGLAAKFGEAQRLQIVLGRRARLGLIIVCRIAAARKSTAAARANAATRTAAAAAAARTAATARTAAAAGRRIGSAADSTCRRLVVEGVPAGAAP